ncbi:MAG: sn-glycerol-3-phosphate ABC transporter ATP-binding protein UgpC [Trueperaceae bacterium]|nr:sn-glycerol-3-phosphate ABC transporter ATP-binding protein UgpC [Trueperaceae bacterium]
MGEVIMDGIYKRFGDVVAVQDFNLKVENEEFVVLVGPSGCGKTTTLRMIAGLEEISDGTLSIDDKVVNDVPPKDRDIAMVFQNYALYPHMNVHQNMSFGLRLRKTPKDEIQRRVQDAADILQIGHLLDRRPRELSGGQRQRVALGRAIVREPKVFLMDEPLSNLDAKLRVEMRASISKLHKRLGVTTVYVTHDQVEAMTMGTRIVLMKDGVIHQVADPITLYDKPVNRFVAGFIGSPAMNFMVGEVTDGRLKSANFDIKPNGELLEKLHQHRNKKVYVGIRPENLGLKGYTTVPEKDNVVRATIEVVEPLGAETHILASVGGDQTVVARVDPHAPVNAGDEIELLADPDFLHAFDMEGDEPNLRFA